MSGLIVSILMQTFQWTAVFFAVEGLDYGILDYLLRSRRVNVMHVDEVSLTRFSMFQIIITASCFL